MTYNIKENIENIIFNKNIKNNTNYFDYNYLSYSNMRLDTKIDNLDDNFEAGATPLIYVGGNGSGPTDGPLSQYNNLIRKKLGKVEIEEIKEIKECLL